MIEILTTDKIVIEGRFRKEFDTEIINKMVEGFKNPEAGLLEPIIVAKLENSQYKLLAGETRLKAVNLAAMVANDVYFQGKILPARAVPCLVIEKTSPLSELQIELAENTIRKSFTWQEQMSLERKIADLIQADTAKAPTKEEADKSLEILGQKPTTYHRQKLRESINISEALEDEESAPKFKHCKSRKDAERVLKRIQREAEDQLLAKEIGKEFAATKHKLIRGDCLDILPTLKLDSFDLCITDPPYGINAHKFGNAAGRMASFSHDYDDSPETWLKLMPEFLSKLSLVMKPKSHIYLACDIGKFEVLKGLLKAVKEKEWQIQRTPIIELKAFGRVPVIDFYYRRMYECWLYARTGEKNSRAILDDVIMKSKLPKGHHAATKSEAAFSAFLQTSGQAGGKVIDPFMGSASLLKSADDTGMLYVGIEKEEIAYGKACKTLKQHS